MKPHKRRVSLPFIPPGCKAWILSLISRKGVVLVRELIFSLFAVSFCLILLILAVRDKSSYIEIITVQIFKFIRIEIVSAEKKRPPEIIRRHRH